MNDRQKAYLLASLDVASADAADDDAACFAAMERCEDAHHALDFGEQAEPDAILREVRLGRMTPTEARALCAP